MAAKIAGLTHAARAAGMRKGGYIPMGMIRWRLGNVHCRESLLTVAREFWFERCRKLPRPIKRAVVRAALLEHLSNRRLYNHVMRGV